MWTLLLAVALAQDAPEPDATPPLEATDSASPADGEPSNTSSEAEPAQPEVSPEPEAEPVLEEAPASELDAPPEANPALPMETEPEEAAPGPEEAVAEPEEAAAEPEEPAAEPEEPAVEPEEAAAESEEAAAEPEEAAAEPEEAAAEPEEAAAEPEEAAETVSSDATARWEDLSPRSRRDRYLGAGYRRLARGNRVVAEALDLLEHVCGGDDPDLCLDLAADLSLMGSHRDEYASAYSTTLEACEQRLPQACRATLLFNNTGKARALNAPRYAERIALGCEGSVVVSCVDHARRQPKDARPDVLTFGCEGGDGASCAALARSVRKDEPERAETLYAQACDLGHGPTCWDRFRAGGSRRIDTSDARYAGLADICDAGGSGACITMAKANLRGNRREQDPVEALVRYEQACDAGRESACRDAGRMHGKGKGTERNTAKRRYFMSDLGNPRAPLRIMARIGTPVLVAVHGEYILPNRVGPAVGIAGALGLLPLDTLIGDEQFPNGSASQLQVRLYPSNTGRGLYLAAGLGVLRINAKPGTFGQSEEAGDGWQDGANDRPWGFSEVSMASPVPGGAIGVFTHSGRVAIGLEIGASYLTDRRMLQGVQFADSTAGVLPTFNLSLGGAFR